MFMKLPSVHAVSLKRQELISSTSILRYIKPVNRRKRVAFPEKYVNNPQTFWNNMLFSDECDLFQRSTANEESASIKEKRLMSTWSRLQMGFKNSEGLGSHRVWWGWTFNTKWRHYQRGEVYWDPRRIPGNMLSSTAGGGGCAQSNNDCRAVPRQQYSLLKTTTAEPWFEPDRKLLEFPSRQVIWKEHHPQNERWCLERSMWNLVQNYGKFTVKII